MTAASTTDRERRWKERRAEALIAVADLAACPEPRNAQMRGEVARLVHRIACAPSLLDDDTVCGRARTLERALRGRTEWGKLRVLAEDLLAAV